MTNNTNTLFTVALITILVFSVNSAIFAADIVDTAVQAGTFKTLVKAVQEAGLEDVLRGPGPFTVFAPTDRAFSKLPSSTLKSLMQTRNREKLTDILTYHVIPGLYTARDVLHKQTLKTVEGSSVLISKSDMHVMIDDADVLKTDIKASNGIIHVIDTVITPKNIAERAVSAGIFKTLVTAVTEAGLLPAIKSDNPITVFAPTDEAFKKLGNQTISELLKTENTEKLAKILKHHIVEGIINFSERNFTTLSDTDITVKNGEGFHIGKSKILIPDVYTTNGVIHVIDSVLLPEIPEASNEDKAIMIIQNAISRGAPLFNRGDHDACALIYEITLERLMDQDSIWTEKDRKVIAASLVKGKSQDRWSDKAWTYRMTLDKLSDVLKSR